MRVVFSDDAILDLDEIAAFIAADSVAYARSTVKELRSKARELGQMPERFAVAVRRGEDVVRRRPYGEYSIFYYVEPGKYVVVSRILHSARNHQRILFPED